MKKTTYKFNNTINKSNNNDSDFLDKLIEAGILKNNPWLGKEKIDTNKELEFLTSLDGLIDILTTPAKPKKKTTIEIEITKKKKAPKTLSIFEMLNYLSALNEKDSYDGLTEDGTPFKIYDNFIQVGYDYIPFTASSFFIDKLKPATKKNIIEIYIDLTK